MAAVESGAMRRTQAERVDAMQARLLDATVDLLVEKGWAKLSTNDVVRRAKVSRGALAHHYPTKAALVEAAAQHLIEQRVTEFQARFSALDPAQRTVDAALDLLWEYCQGPTFAALLELMAAARTDPELRLVLASEPGHIGDATYGMFVEFFPAVAGNPMAATALRAAVALMTGMSVHSILDGDVEGHHAELLAWLKAMARIVVPEARNQD